MNKQPWQLQLGYTSWWPNPKNQRLYPKKTPQWWYALHDLWCLGFNDGEISRALDKTNDSVWKTRTTLGLPPNAAVGGQRQTEVTL